MSYVPSDKTLDHKLGVSSQLVYCTKGLTMKTQQQLQEWLDYDVSTGVFTWKQGRRIGKVAGSINSQGYRDIGFNNRTRMKAHRVAWIMSYGDVLTKNDRLNTIDHINRIKDDNRLSNLRLISAYGNASNKGMHPLNTSGETGIAKRASTSGREYYQIRVSVDGKRHTAVAYTLEDAIQTRERLRNG